MRCLPEIARRTEQRMCARDHRLASATDGRIRKLGFQRPALPRARGLALRRGDNGGRPHCIARFGPAQALSSIARYSCGTGRRHIRQSRFAWSRRTARLRHGAELSIDLLIRTSRSSSGFPASTSSRPCRKPLFPPWGKAGHQSCRAPAWCRPAAPSACRWRRPTTSP